MKEANWSVVQGTAENSTLSPSEAVVGFLGWVATRHAVTTLGGGTATAGLQALADSFIKANNLPELRENWGESLESPPENMSDFQAVNPIDTLRNILRATPEYAEVWHHSIASIVFECIPEDSVLPKTTANALANKIAGEFLHQTFNLKVEYKGPELVA